jgi:tetratricopeptide (TPR) repeat protein
MNKKSLLELYEQDLLSESEKQAFLQLVAQHQERERLREILNQPKPVLTAWRIVWAAAASVLFAAIGWWIVSKSTLPLSPQQAFAQVASPTSHSGTLLGEPQIPLDSVMRLFNQTYAAKKYQDCIQLESKIAAADVETQILLAYCYIQTNNYSKSIALLEKLYAEPNDSKEEIRWWLGLSYGLAGDKPNMKKYLSEIAPKQFHYQEAQSLIK